MDNTARFTVLRAKPADAAGIAEFVTAATRGRVAVAPESVLERFGAKGLWLLRDASEGIVGLAGWRAENLVARIDDFMIFPIELYPSAGKVLVESIEAAAKELQCEVVMLFLPVGASATLIRLFESCDYRRPELDRLPRVWHDTIEEATTQGRYIMLHQLRDDLVLRPI